MNRTTVLPFITLFSFASALIAGVYTPALDEDGWSILEPSDDSRIIYVSSSEGDDQNDGLSPDSAKQTLSAAGNLLRDGKPDQLLLKRGDEWLFETLGAAVAKSGRSFDERLVIGAYGEGTRPLLRLDTTAYDLGGRRVENLAIVGIAFNAESRDPSSIHYNANNPGNYGALRIIGTGKNILIEDCAISHCQNGLAIDGYSDDGEGDYFENVALRRLIVTHSWMPNSYYADAIANGAFASDVFGLLIEECSFDQNGYHDSIDRAGPNMFNHNIYLQYTSKDVFIRGNMIVRAAAQGIQMRSFGTLEDTFFSRNAIGVNFGGISPPTVETKGGHGRNNVFIEGEQMDLDNADWPRTAAVWGIWLWYRHTLLEYNIIANRLESGVNNAFPTRDGGSFTDVGNIVYQWDPTYDTVNPDWIDPERSLSDYSASIGETEDMDAFMDLVTSRLPGTWDDAYAAYGVNAYMRSGFRVAGESYIDAYPSSRHAHHDGGSLRFMVLSNQEWSISGLPDWIEVDVSSGNGDGELRLTVSSNATGETREGSILISSGDLERSLFVYQQPHNFDPYIGSPDEIFVASGAGGTSTVRILSNVDWVAETTTDWISLRTETGSGSGDLVFDSIPYLGARPRTGNITVSLAGNPDEKLFIRISQGLATWAGFPFENVEADVNADTLLGWINVSADPWVYSYLLNDFVFLPESWVSEAGSWLLALSSFSSDPGVDNGFGSWRGIPLANSAGDLELGDGWGWANVAESPFIYSYLTGKWMYLFTSTESDTTWLYLFR